MGEGTVRERGVDMDTRLYSTWRTDRTCWTAQGTRLWWQPGWEGCLGESGHLHTFG